MKRKRSTPCSLLVATLLAAAAIGLGLGEKPAFGDLMLLHPDGREELLAAGGKDGFIVDPVVSYDGQWIYYAHFPGLKQAHNDAPSPLGGRTFTRFTCRGERSCA